MRRGPRAGIAAALAIASAAAVTAGCGGGSTNALALDPVSAAVTKTQKAGAARIHLALAIKSPQLHGKTLRMRGAGTVDGSSAELTFRVGSILRLTGIPPGVSPTATMAKLMHASMKEIVLEEQGNYVLYLRLGVLSASAPGGKQWIKLDLSKLGKAAGLDLGKLLSGTQFQPGDLLSMLRANGAKIRKVGSARVEGAATTQYHVTIDMTKALGANATSPLLAGVAAQMGTIPEDVWIGKDGLVRRVRLSYGLAQTRVSTTMDLYDYGAHVTIAAPPKSAVFDATQLAQQNFGSAFH